MGRLKSWKRPGAERWPDGGGPPLAGLGRLHAAVPLLAAITLIAALLIGSLSSGDDPPPGPKTAAIVDQLNLTAPNPDFVRSATDTLRQAGYVVDYFPGRQVTVDFYRELPTHGYDLIVLRVHSARQGDLQQNRFQDEVGLFTSEPYSEALYVEEQRAGRIGLATYPGRPELYFGMLTEFFKSDMKGDFAGATVIMMGCNGLSTERLAEAFLEKGAGSFVSWSQPVSAEHTDAATERLLEYLRQGFSPPYAVALTSAEVGPDPLTNAELRILTAESRAG